MKTQPRRSSKRIGPTAKRRVTSTAYRDLRLARKLAKPPEQILKLQELTKTAQLVCGLDELDSEGTEWSISAVTHFDYSMTRHPDDSLAVVGWLNLAQKWHCNTRIRFGDPIEDLFGGPLVLRCSVSYHDFGAAWCGRLAQEKLDKTGNCCCYIELEEKGFHSLWPDVERKTRNKANSNPHSTC